MTGSEENGFSSLWEKKETEKISPDTSNRKKKERRTSFIRLFSRPVLREVGFFYYFIYYFFLLPSSPTLNRKIKSPFARGTIPSFDVNTSQNNNIIFRRISRATRPRRSDSNRVWFFHIIIPNDPSIIFHGSSVIFVELIFFLRRSKLCIGTMKFTKNQVYTLGFVDKILLCVKK